MISSFVPMACSAIITVVIAVVLVFLIQQVREFVLKKRAAKAKQYLIGETQRYYFYGYPLAECLLAGMADGLRRRSVGDFTKQLGILILCALKESIKQPTMYYRWHEKTENTIGHHEVVMRFMHNGRWWQFNLDQDLDEDSLRRVRIDSKNNRLDVEWRAIDYWKLGRGQRRILDECTNPKKSNLLPDVRYVDAESEAEYTKLVYHAVDKVMEFWYFFNGRTRRSITKSKCEECDAEEQNIDPS